MTSETLKLGLIERLMKVQKTTTLKRLDQLMTQAELESNTQESMDAIIKEEVVSLDDFKKANQKWAKENHTK